MRFTFHWEQTASMKSDILKLKQNKHGCLTLDDRQMMKTNHCNDGCKDTGVTETVLIDAVNREKEALVTRTTGEKEVGSQARDNLEETENIVDYGNIEGLCPTEDLEARVNLYGHKNITKSHYIDVSTKSYCANPLCKTAFSFHVRPHHCRRCGEVFCRNCLQLQRKLNRLAQPDPDGVLCKVCKQCFTESNEDHSITKRSLTDIFVKTRSMAKTEINDIRCDLIIETKNASVVPAFWREQFQLDVLHECRRLLDGFSMAVSTSQTYIHKTKQDLRNLVEVPAWQKSVFWKLEKTISSCRICHAKFSKFGSGHKVRNCRVCGLALCKACSNKELLVYFADKTGGDEINIPRVAIIRVDGSPEVEPDVSVLLYVCPGCKEEIVNRQLEDPEWFEEKPQLPDVMSQAVKLHDELTVIQEVIQDKETETQQLLHARETQCQTQPDITTLSLDFQSHIRTCRKDLQDVSKHLTHIASRLSEFPSCIQRLKKLRECHLCRSKESLLIQNIIKSKCDFYLQHKQMFHENERKLHAVLDI